MTRKLLSTAAAASLAAALFLSGNAPAADDPAAQDQAKKIEAQMDAATAKVNADPALIKRAEALAKANKTKQMRSFLLDAGAPKALVVSGTEVSGGVEAMTITVSCTFTYPPARLKCTVTLGAAGANRYN